jgi:outer membrane protein assembly factor BamB
MFLITRVHSRRVLLLGAAGLVPAALVTLLLVHQPSIGDRRLYPMLRGSLALVGLVLALATLITWATAPNRVSRTSLTGLAWAGVTMILCIGPFLESNPRPRLYALELQSGEVVWSSAQALTAPRLVHGDLVVTDIDDRADVGLEPKDGGVLWREPINTTETRVGQATAAGPAAPGSAGTSTPEAEVGMSSVGLEGEGWSLPFPGEAVLAVASVGEFLYVYVATPGADGGASGRVLKLDGDIGGVEWTRSLDETVAVGDGTAAIAANDEYVVVAGGERIAVLDARNGDQQWTESVVTLGKSRGYALPGAVQHVAIDDDHVYLSTTPDS